MERDDYTDGALACDLKYALEGPKPTVKPFTLHDWLEPDLGSGMDLYDAVFTRDVVVDIGWANLFTSKERHVGGIGWFRTEPSTNVINKRIAVEKVLLPSYFTWIDRTNERLDEAIEKSRHILDLKDDWDDEGSSGYAEATWRRAIDFLRENYRRLSISARGEVAVPRVLPGPEGTIDLHWKTNEVELLINIPVDIAGSAEFYGDRGEANVIKGKVDTRLDCSWILAWLMM